MSDDSPERVAKREARVAWKRAHQRLLDIAMQPEPSGDELESAARCYRNTRIHCALLELDEPEVYERG